MFDVIKCCAGFTGSTGLAGRNRPAAALARRLTGAALGASLLVASHAYASGVAQLKTFVAQVHSARGAFEQKEIKAPRTGQTGQTGQATGQNAGDVTARTPTTMSGTFVFARPGKFIWSYQKPYQQLLQADGENLYVYDKDLNQVTQRRLNGSLGASPAAILFGSNDLEKNFALRDIGVKNGTDWLELTPKTKDTQFQSVDIGFRNGNLEAMELHDVFGNTTTLTFSGIQKNPPLNAAQFRFVKPKGADLIGG